MDVARPALEQAQNEHARGDRTGKQQRHDGVGQQFGIFLQPENGRGDQEAHHDERPGGIRQSEPEANPDTGQRGVRHGVAEKGHAAGSHKNTEQRAERRQKQRGEQGPLHERFSEHGSGGTAKRESRTPV